MLDIANGHDLYLLLHQVSFHQVVNHKLQMLRNLLVLLQQSGLGKGGGPLKDIVEGDNFHLLDLQEDIA